MVGAEGRKFSNLRWSRRQENAIPRRNSNKKMCKIKVSLTFLEGRKSLNLVLKVLEQTKGGRLNKHWALMGIQY